MSNAIPDVAGLANGSTGRIGATRFARAAAVRPAIATPSALADASIIGGYVNAANDGAAQLVSGVADPGVSVTIYDNGTVLGTVTATSTGAWSFTLGKLADGSHSLTAVATDPAGTISSTSTALAFTVDTVAPSAPGGLSYSAVNGGYVNAAHNGGSQTVSGSAEGGTTVTLYDNGAVIGTTAANATTGVWSVTLSGLLDGRHSLTATATDAAGNVSAASAALGFTVNTEAVGAPSALADGAITNRYVNALGNTPAQTLTGNAPLGASVTVYDGGAVLGATTADATTGKWSYVLGQLADGSHSLTATASDVAGNTSLSSAALAFTVDTQPPAAPGALADSAVSNGYVNALHDTGAQALTGTAALHATIKVYDNGALLGTTVASAVTGAWSFTLGVLADGSHSLTATATDVAGNVSLASSAYAFNVVTTTPAVPAGLADSYLIGAYLPAYANTTVDTVTGTAAAGTTITVTSGTTRLGTATTTSAGTWACVIGLLTLGIKYNLTATATDAAGNVSAPSAVLSFKVVSALPTIPTGLVDSLARNGYVNARTNLASQTLQGYAASGQTVSIYDNGVLVGTTTGAGSSKLWSFKLGVLASGSHSFTATATDVLGDVSATSTALGVIVDTRIPIPVLTNLTENLAGGKVAATGTTEAGATVTLAIGGKSVATAGADAGGLWSATFTATLGNSVNRMTLTAVDPAGNTGSGAVPILFAGANAKITTTSASVVIGAAGDTITLGAGQNTVEFHAGFGKETVKGFTATGAGATVLQFDASVFATYAALLGATTQSGANLLITADAADVITLTDVTKAQLGAANARFV